MQEDCRMVMGAGDKNEFGMRVDVTEQKIEKCEGSVYDRAV